jgi:uncharacterized protein with NRDE domain
LSQFLLIILIQTSLGLIYSWISFLTIQALHLGQSFNRFLAIHDDAEVSLKQMVEELMTDTAKADRSAVPDTGVDSNWEYQLSSIFIDTEKGQVNMHDSTRFMLFSAKKKNHFSWLMWCARANAMLILEQIQLSVFPIWQLYRAMG